MEEGAHRRRIVRGLACNGTDSLLFASSCHYHLHTINLQFKRPQKSVPLIDISPTRTTRPIYRTDTQAVSIETMPETRRTDGEGEASRDLRPKQMEQTFAATALCLPACLPIINWRFFAVSLPLSFPPRSSTIKPIDRDGPSINNARQRVGRSDSQINRDLSLRGRTSRGR